MSYLKLDERSVNFDQLISFIVKTEMFETMNGEIKDKFYGAFKSNYHFHQLCH